MIKQSDCPDLYTIQAVADGEETDHEVIAHVNHCFSCSAQLSEIRVMQASADRLNLMVKLPLGFYDQLESKLIAVKPFPAAIFIAVIMFLAMGSALLLQPGYLQWWLSVGITRQFGLLLDLWFNLYYLALDLSPPVIAVGFALLVILELIMLSKLKTVEG